MFIEMARYRGSKHSTPDRGQTVRTYAQLHELYAAYAKGLINLLVVLGPPGLGKGQGLQTALKGTGGLYVKGYYTRLKFHMDLFRHKDKPIAVDDADAFLADSGLRESIKHLSESDEYKKIDYGSTTKVLEKEGVPGYFFTKSSLAIVCNSWDENDPISKAIESRAEFIHFDPTWAEVYKEIGQWFWDEQIYDYLWEKLPFLKQPDMRLVKRAWGRKKGRLKTMPWKQVIDSHIDDEANLMLREMLAKARDGRKTPAKLDAKQAKVVTMGDMVEEWCAKTGLDQATFYRRKTELEKWSSLDRPPKIKLSRDAPPIEERPADEFVSESDLDNHEKEDPTDEGDDDGVNDGGFEVKE